ncbi:hypothetical protein ACMSIO_01390 [Pseudomonas benzopyrenica]|uniref:hypothetical protein n=1 Tax=Pseudomonas benzopyrenica TaxID=2993566 RepID=UPI0039C182CF
MKPLSLQKKKVGDQLDKRKFFGGLYQDVLSKPPGAMGLFNNLVGVSAVPSEGESAAIAGRFAKSQEYKRLAAEEFFGKLLLVISG